MRWCIPTMWCIKYLYVQCIQWTCSKSYRLLIMIGIFLLNRILSKDSLIMPLACINVPVFLGTCLHQVKCNWVNWQNELLTWLSLLHTLNTNLMLLQYVYWLVQEAEDHEGFWCHWLGYVFSVMIHFTVVILLTWGLLLKLVDNNLIEIVFGVLSEWKRVHVCNMGYSTDYFKVSNCIIPELPLVYAYNWKFRLRLCCQPIIATSNITYFL